MTRAPRRASCLRPRSPSGCCGRCPGSSGHQIEQIPVANPATATAGISIHDPICGFGRASDITLSNARPTAAASGAMASARMTNR